MSLRSREDGWWAERYADDRLVHTYRYQTLPHRVRETVEEAREATSDLRSAVFGVAQYWDDNADDEVHVSVLYSARSIPELDHECSRGAYGLEPSLSEQDHCSYCCRPLPDAYGWGYGELIPPLEGFCHENGSQHQGDLSNNRLLAVARFEDDDLHVQTVFDLARPWLDEARGQPDPLPLTDTAQRLLATEGSAGVLQDYWLSEGDPRGEYLARVLQRDPSPEQQAEAWALWLDHHRSWLGGLGAVVPRAGVRFGGPWLEHLSIYCPPDEYWRWDRNDPAFLGVRHLRFLPGSDIRVGDAMRFARTLGPLDHRGLTDLIDSHAAFAVQHLSVEMEDPVLLSLLETHRLPNLKRVTLLGPCATREAVDLLASLDVAVDVAPSGQEFLDTVDRFAGQEVRVIQRDPDTGAAGGWAVTLGERPLIERTALHSTAVLPVIEGILRLEGLASAEIRSGPWWDPSPEAMEQLR